MNIFSKKIEIYCPQVSRIFRDKKTTVFRSVHIAAKLVIIAKVTRIDAN